MLRQASTALSVSVALLFLPACGSGSKGAAEETASDATPASAETSTTTTASTGTVKKPDPIAQGDAADVKVPEAPADAADPSLTLFNMGNSKLNWNDVGTMGTSYQVFRRSKDGSFDETTPLDTLQDAASFTLQETPGLWCYKIRAQLPAKKVVDSNEVCIKGPDLLVFGSLAPQSIAATQSLALPLQALGGSGSVLFSCVRNCPLGLSIEGSSNILSWTPSINQLGPLALVLQAKSASQVAEQTLSLNVTEAPLSFTAPAAQHIVATQSLQFGLQADAHGHLIQYSCVQACPAGFLVQADSGLVNWTPTFAQSGTFAVVLQASTAAQSLTQTLSIQVDEAPLSFSAPLAQTSIATEDFQFQLMADALGQTITFSCAKDCPSGLSVDAATGTITWTPRYDQSGTYLPIFQAEAGTQKIQRPLSVTIQEAPLIFTSPVTQTVVATETLQYKLQADARGLAITYSCSQNCPQGLAIDAALGQLTWTPRFDQSGNFLVTLDARAGNQTQQRTLAIQVAEAPLTFAAPANQSVVATESLALNLVADAKGQTISYSCTQNCPQGLTVDGTTGGIAWTPRFDQTGSYAITLEAKAGTQSLQRNLTIEVTEAPLTFTAPLAQNLIATNALTLNLQADAKGQTITYSCVQNCPQGLTVDAASGLVSWTPRFDQIGLFTLTLEAHAGTQTLQKTLSLQVAEAPLTFTAPLPQSVVATEALSFSLQADAKGQTITYSCVQNCPQGLAIDAATGLVSWTPRFDQYAAYNVTLRAHAGTQSLDQTLAITVTEAPLVFSALPDQRVVANQSLSLPLMADARGQAVTWSCTANCPAGFSIGASSGLLSWTPRFDQSGRFTVTLAAHAGTQNVQQNLNITVDEAPLSFQSPSTQRLVATEGMRVQLQADAGGQTIQYACIQACPPGLTVNAITGVVDWTPAIDQVGDFAPLLTAHAGSQTLQQTLSLTVVQAFINLTLSTTGTLKGEHSIGIELQGSSNLSGAMSTRLTLKSGPSVVLIPNAQGWSFMAPNLRQLTNFTFTAHAEIGTVSRDQDIDFAVVPNDHGPTLAAFANQTIVASEAFQLQAVAADQDGDSLEFACILDCPAGFTIDSANGLMSWQPGLNQSGSYNPSIQVAANGQTQVKNLSLLVQAPYMTISAASISGVSGQTVNISVSQSTNLTGPFQYSISQATGPVATLSGSNGQWSFLAPLVYVPTNLGFDVVVSNGMYSQLRNFVGRVDPQPIAPTVDAGPDVIANQATSLVATVSPNAQTFSWSKVSGPGTLSFTTPSAPSTQVSASADGTYVVRLTASNYWGQSSTDELSMIWDTTAPTVDVGSDIRSSVAITRSATVSGAATLLWSMSSGPGTATFTAGTSATTNIDADRDGDYVIRLTARDNAGNSAFSEFTLSLDKTAPTVDLGPARVSNLADITLFSTVSSDVVSYSWTKVSGPGTVTFTYPDQEDTPVNFSADGVYTVRQTVIDSAGNTSSIDLLVTIDRSAPVINPLVLGPTVADGYLNIAERTVANPLIAAASASDLTAVTFTYKLVLSSLTCNASLVYAAAIPQTNDAAFTTKGTYKVCVQATDSFNLAAFASSPDIIYDTGTVSVVLSNLPSTVSSANQLNITVSGTDVSHYRFKVGLAASTLCSDATAYSVEQDVSLPLTSTLSSLADGSLRLCAIGRNLSGNWQSTSTAYQYTWTADRTAPDQPQGFASTTLTQRVKFNWTKDSSVAGYIIVRRTEAAQPWQPIAGLSYAAGLTVDSERQVVSNSSLIPEFDNNPQAGTAYTYTLYAYDSALNYSPGVEANGTATATLPLNIANGFDRNVRIIVPARDGSGKYYVAGDFLVYGNKVASRIARLNSDMSFDTSFVAPLLNNIVYALAASSDGKVYVGGAFTSFTGFSHTRLVRLNSDGSVDGSFNVGTTGFNSTIQSLALDESLNRLYVGGAFTTYKGVASSRLLALKTMDGTVDSSFNCGTCVTTASSTINAMSIIAGLGVYVGGTFTVVNGITVNRLAKISAGGAVDTVFTPATGTIGFDSTITTLDQDAQGYLYVGGSFGKYRGSANAYRFTRLVPGTGIIDSSLAITSKFNGTVWTVKVDPDGGLYVGGDFTAYGTSLVNRLVRLNGNGSLDSSFGVSGGVMNWSTTANAGFPVLTLAVNSSEVLVGGAFVKYGTDNVPYFARLSRSGAVLSGTPRGTMFGGAVYALAKTANAGEVLVGGYFNTYKGAASYRLAKIDRSGAMDTTIANAITTAGSYVYALATDPVSGKFYAGGTFTAPSGRLARFNSNGTADTTFNSAVTTTGFNSDVYAIAYDASTGGVYVGGKFTTIKTTGMAAATTVNYLVRLLPNGTLDSSFITGTAFNGQVNALVVMDDGTILVGGTFTTYNGTSANRFIRLNPNGSAFNGFDIGTGFNSTVQTISYVKADRAIYIGGAFTTLRGITANRLVKLDETGAVYAGWSIGTGVSSTVYALNWDSDQEVLWLGGNFSTVRSVTVPRMAAVNRDGSLHTAFAPGAISINGDVRAIAASYYGAMFGTTGSTYRNQVFDFLGRFLFNATLQ